MQYQHYLGIDVGKRELFCVIIDNHKKQIGKTRSFPNTKEGVRRIIQWLHSLQIKHKNIHAIMEATSSYWQLSASLLDSNTIAVSVVQPIQIANYGKVLMKRSKTDSSDAKTIAMYGLAQSPTLWTPADPYCEKARALSRRIQQTQQMLYKEGNHLEHCHDKAVQKDIRAHMKQLEKRLLKLRELLQQSISNSPILTKKLTLLKSIVGLGEQSSAAILAELPDLSNFNNARQLAAWAGLTPRHRQSGTSGKVKTPLSKMGSSHLRHLLYMPSLVAIRYNPVLRSFRDRLIENGKNKMQAVGAVMRKLIHIIFGILKSNKPFNPNHLHEINT